MLREMQTALFSIRIRAAKSISKDENRYTMSISCFIQDRLTDKS